MVENRILKISINTAMNSTASWGLKSVLNGGEQRTRDEERRVKWNKRKKKKEGKGKKRRKHPLEINSITSSHQLEGVEGIRGAAKGAGTEPLLARQWEQTWILVLDGMGQVYGVVKMSCCV